MNCGSFARAWERSFDVVIGRAVGDGCATGFGARICREGLDDGETVGDGHLYVEENQIWRVSFDRDDGGVTAIGFPHDLHAGFGAQEAQKFSASRRFVVNNQDAEGGAGHHEADEATVCASM